MIDRRLVRDGAVVAAGQVVTVAGTLIGGRILTDLVPPPVFGTVTLLVGFGTVGVMLACNPYNQAYARFYPDYALRGDTARLSATTVRMLTRTAVLLVVAVLSGGVVLSEATNVPFGAFVGLAAVVVIDFVLTFQMNRLIASRRHKAATAWRVADTLARIATAVGAVAVLGPRPEVILFGYFAGGSAVTVVAFTVRGQIGLPREPANPDIARSIRQYSHPLIPLALVGWVTALSDRYLIGALAGPHAVGIYAAAVGIVSRPYLLSAAVLLQSIRPAYFEAVAHRDTATARYVLRYWLMTAGGIFILGTAVIGSAAGLITRHLLGPDYRAAAELMLPLAVGSTLMNLSHVVNTISLAHNRSALVLWSESGGAATVVLFGIPLTWQYGAFGAAVSTVVAYAAQLGLAWVLCRIAIRNDLPPDDPTGHTTDPVFDLPG